MQPSHFRTSERATRPTSSVHDFSLMFYIAWRLDCFHPSRAEFINQRAWGFHLHNFLEVN